jgi:general secretion pathway protein N
MDALRKPEFFWPAVWGAVAAALVLVLVLEHDFGKVDIDSGAKAPAKVADAKLLPPYTLAPEAQAAPETVARPLFVPSRRPSPPAAAAAVAQMRKGQFVLTGITITPEMSFAYLKEVANGKTQSVKRGAAVNGITVDVVEARRVVLKLGDEVEELSLATQVPPRVATAPAMPGAPGAPGQSVGPGPLPPPPGGAPMAPGTFQPAQSGVPPAPGVQTSTGVPPAPGSVPPAPVAGAVPNPAAAAAAAAGATPPAAGQPMPQPNQPSGRRRPWINAQ